MVNGVIQKPHEGVSMLYSFLNASAPSKRETQYFEMLGNQGIYDKGWTAQTTPPAAPWISTTPEADPISGYNWELYNVAEDPTQSNNLADTYPEKLETMRTTFTMEATKYNVYPIDNSRAARMDFSTRPSILEGRNEVTFFKGMTRMAEGVAPDTKNKDFSIVADVHLPSDSENGVLVTMGGRYSGWVFYLKDGYLKYHCECTCSPTSPFLPPPFPFTHSPPLPTPHPPAHIFYTSTDNLAATARYEVKSTNKVSAGNHQLEIHFDFDGGHAGGGGTATLYVDGVLVGRGRIEKTLCCRISADETFDVGTDTGTEAAPDYEIPNEFQGVLRSLKINLPTPAAEIAREE